MRWFVFTVGVRTIGGGYEATKYFYAPALETQEITGIYTC